MSAIERAIHDLQCVAGNDAVAAAARVELTALRDDLEGLRNKVGQLRAESESIRRGKYGLADLSEQILALTAERDHAKHVCAELLNEIRAYQGEGEFEEGSPTKGHCDLLKSVINYRALDTAKNL